MHTVQDNFNVEHFVDSTKNLFIIKLLKTAVPGVFVMTQLMFWMKNEASVTLSIL